MGLFKVDTDECVSCGACVETCPVKIIEPDKDKHPVGIEDREDRCINCGHCACVCPKGALSLASMPIETLKELPSGWRLSPEQVEAYFKARRSIRAYKGDAVDKTVVERLVDIARYAPSGINRQSVYWMVVYDTTKVKELAGLTIDWMRAQIEAKLPLAESLSFGGIVKSFEAGNDGICRGAPHAVIAYGLKEDMLAQASCTIAMAHFELVCGAFGLGACWAGYLNMALNSHAPARKAAGLSSKTTCHGTMLLGYPKFEFNCIPARNDPRVVWR